MVQMSDSWNQSRNILVVFSWIKEDQFTFSMIQWPATKSRGACKLNVKKGKSKSFILEI